MSNAVAQLGLQVDSRPVNEAAVALARMTKESGAAAQAAGALAAADGGAGAAIDRLTAAITREIAALAQASGALGSAVTASAAASAAANKLAADLGLQAAAWAKAAAAANENARATKAAASGWAALSAAGAANLAEINASQRIAQMNTALNATGPAAAIASGSLRQVNHDALNMSRQIADVGTMLAMGASPFMVLASQGAQITDVMGQRGARGAVALLGEALGALVNPAFIALAALTALGYGAAAIYDSMTEDVRSAEDAIADHADLIRELQREYKSLGDVADDAAKSTRGMLEVRTRAALAETDTQIRREGRRVLQGLGSYTFDGGAPFDPLAPGQGMDLNAPPTFIVDSRFSAFEEPIKRLYDEMERGQPNIDAFVESVTKIAREAGTPEAAQRAKETYGIVQTIRDLFAQRGSLNRASEVMSPEQRRRMDAYRQYGEERAASDAEARAMIEYRAGVPRPKPVNVDFPNPTADLLRDAQRTVDEQTAALRIQASTFGKTAGEIARANEMQRLLNQAQRENIAITPELEASFGSIADAIGRVAQASEDLTRKQEQVVDALDTVRSASSETFGGIARDLAAGKSGAEALRNVLGRLGDRLIDAGADALAGGLFGERGKPGGGLFGGPLGALFGRAIGLPQAEAAAMDAQNALGAMSIGTATISAGTVTIVGYGPAGGGVAFPGAGGGSVGGGAVGIPGAGGSAPYSVPGDYAMPALPGSSQGLYGPPLPPAAPGRFDGAFGQFGKYQWPNKFDDAFSHFQPSGEYTAGGQPGFIDAPPVWTTNGFDPLRAPAGSMGAPPVFPGTPLFGAASAAGASADAAAQSFSKLSDTLATTTPQVGGLGQAIGGILSGGGAAPAAAPGGGLLGLLGGLFGGGGGAPILGAPMLLAGGGRVRGPGSKTSDSVPAMLSNGEFVVNADATSRALPFLEALNENRLPGFADGGYVTRDFDAQMGSIGGGGGNVFSYGDTNIRIDGNADEKTLAEMDRRLDERDRKRQREMERNAGRYNTAYGKRRG